MSRLSDLISYFVEALPGSGRTQIVKFLYLADYEARRYLGRPLSDLAYRWDKHGPFDPRILHELERLQDNGTIRRDEVSFFGGEIRGQQYFAESPQTTGPIADADRAILATVVKMYGETPLRQLLEDVVYETEPMRDAQDRKAFGQPLRMELVDCAERIPGLELEDVLQADEDLRAGKGIPLSEVMAESRE